MTTREKFRKHHSAKNNRNLFYGGKVQQWKPLTSSGPSKLLELAISDKIEI